MSASPARHLVFAIPGDLDAPSGGYSYDRRMIAELGGLGWQVDVLALPAGFPLPGRADLAATAAAFRALPDGALVLVDGLAFGALPDVARSEGTRLRIVALVHHPLALEDGLAAPVADALRASEREALARARAVVATSSTTARLLSIGFGVGSRIAVAPPGTERPAAPLERPSSRMPTILSVGSLIPRKDHALLVDALTGLVERPWRCRIVGSETADPPTARALKVRIADAGLERRIAVVGAVRDVAAEYRTADIFALPSRFEGYGMAFAEAMAHGLPIVGCDGGAVSEVVPSSAGMLVEPGDAQAFTRALEALIRDAALRQRMADGALEAAARLPTWGASARILSDALEAVR
ncbi:glycosyltransferase family 4 protein [Aureimonas phyllosphaerae]|uniref:Glycosyltransferase involved in cell wall biosynthesis n=1 Tax=Aureimonas phyllosphaerae TaxID=1166078 RepID=A0A7W6BXW7_9HYPH|nr:glycosyltransferase family 4 protein [Aureimonas phyllosphaerae]MBB3935711.1 glycosyltransferase involved in cell wall biosynthesis [Aureimonas phyllosphaerae]MBB3959719.1 glycosyltransferase involved in cell wall biosynthesis [Aureimonas phyllosphaerae]SFF14175.1 Glycosyl transferases group 1 [Aureimonas phyllosphaerae]